MNKTLAVVYKASQNGWKKKKKKTLPRVYNVSQECIKTTKKSNRNKLRGHTKLIERRDKLSREDFVNFNEESTRVITRVCYWILSNKDTSNDKEASMQKKVLGAFPFGLVSSG